MVAFFNMKQKSYHFTPFFNAEINVFHPTSFDVIGRHYVWKMWLSVYKLKLKLKLKLRGLNPHANYTDRAAAAGRRS